MSADAVGLAVTLLVRDEADIIAATIEHFLAQGAGTVIVTDNGSIDGTGEILLEYASDDRIVLLEEPDHSYQQSTWVTRMARMAARDYGADWVINADADEFWIPKERSLRLLDSLAAVPCGYGIVRAVRVNLVGPPGDSGGWLSRLGWRDLGTQSTMAPKVCHRASPDVVVDMGNHNVHAVTPEAVLPVEPIEIIHLPQRSWSQFLRRTRNGGSAMEMSDHDAATCWHWRADFKLLAGGELADTYSARSLSQEQAAEDPCRFRRDAAFRDYVESLLPEACRPDVLRSTLSYALSADGSKAR